MGLKLAFHEGTDLTAKHLLAAVPEVRPLSQTDPERVAAITEWLERHAKPAGDRKDRPDSSGAMRKRRVVT